MDLPLIRDRHGEVRPIRHGEIAGIRQICSWRGWPAAESDSKLVAWWIREKRPDLDPDKPHNAPRGGKWDKK